MYFNLFECDYCRSQFAVDRLKVQEKCVSGCPVCGRDEHHVFMSGEVVFKANLLFDKKISLFELNGGN